MKPSSKNTGCLVDSSGVPIKRIRISLEGFVQGLGFRPFVYRIANKYDLDGWVANSVAGVEIAVEGESDSLERFLEDLETKKPPLSHITNRRIKSEPLRFEKGFSVKESDLHGEKSALILPDIAICPDCLEEIRNPRNRRYRYPFTNCTYCGPRYSIVEAIPYDRGNTTMRHFHMCPECWKEYNNPEDRRFHAQPNACPRCGPKLALLDRSGNSLSIEDDALLTSAEEIRRGRIIALKGLGGFQLLVDARNETAIKELRRRKRRQAKPFAVMFPNADLIAACCSLSRNEMDTLRSPQSPIVLLRKRAGSNGHSLIAESVAPENQYLGAMLPYTPLHVLLMDELEFPVVATSGNLSDEPICIDEDEAIHRLGEIADCFLVHDRAIARPVDDSVARIIDGSPQVLRAARGYAPLTFERRDGTEKLLAVGAHQKNSIAVARGNKITVSQHLGDQDSALSRKLFRQTIDAFLEIYDITPERVISDLHPGYAPSEYAGNMEILLEVRQHHFCHIAACIAENDIELPCLGIAWDGTGLGPDGTIRGSEFIIVDENHFKRVGHIRNFLLPGGDKAVLDTRRSAIGLLYEIYGDEIFELSRIIDPFSFSANEINAFKKILPARLNCSVTSSAGRLFDAVAAILNICHKNHYEGQAGMMLESRALLNPTEDTYPIDIVLKEHCHILDYSEMIREIINDVVSANNIAIIPAKFHNSLVKGIVMIADKIGIRNIALSGGCFQNALLQEKAILALRDSGRNVYIHHRVPPNDGGISFGQAAATKYAKDGN